MGLLTRYLAATPDAVQGAAVDAGLGVETYVGEQALGSSAPPWEATTVDRAAAVSVPAVARARNVIAGTVGLLPLVALGPDGHPNPRPRPWVRQPERDVPAAHTFTWTADDLLFHGRSYWRVVREYREDGRPMLYERVSPARVSPVTAGDGRTVVGWNVDGKRAPRLGPGRLVVFHGLDEGLLSRAALTINVARMLERAAGNYASEPVPASILRNPEGGLLPDSKVEELLGKWRTARRTSGTAYMAQLQLEAVGIDPSTMQLAEARQHVALEIARQCNVDASYLNANEPGASLTYANVTQRRGELVDFTLRHYLTAIEGRLGMGDVTGPGEVVRFDLDDFLRGDAKTRAEVLEVLRRADVVDRDEARAMWGITPTAGDRR